MSSFKSVAKMAFESIEMESFRRHVVWKVSKTEKVFSILWIAELVVRAKPSKTNIVKIV